MMQRIYESTERCTTGRFSGQFISESTTEFVTIWGCRAGFVYSSIRLFALCIAVAMFFILYFAKTGGLCYGREMSGLLCDRRGAVEV